MLAESIESVSFSSKVPKNEQIAGHIQELIIRKKLVRGDKLLSISRASEQLNISCGTVVKAYEKLRRRGIIESRPGHGFFVATNSIRHTIKVFFLLNAFNNDQRVLYDAFRKRLGEKGEIDVFFHHYNVEIFKSLLLDNLGNYGVYVVKPFHDQRIEDVLRKVDAKNFLILDRHDFSEEKYSYICQDFEDSVCDCLESGLPLVKKYEMLNIVMPADSLHPHETLKGFDRFCQKCSVRGNRLFSIDRRQIAKGQAYFVIFDSDLERLLTLCDEKGYKVGQDIGIISYNETPLKKFIAGGTTVLSTDFEEMGTAAAEYVLNPKPTHKIVPTKLIVRKSL